MAVSMGILNTYLPHYARSQMRISQLFCTQSRTGAMSHQVQHKDICKTLSNDCPKAFLWQPLRGDIMPWIATTVGNAFQRPIMRWWMARQRQQHLTQLRQSHNRIRMAKPTNSSPPLLSTDTKAQNQGTGCSV